MIGLAGRARDARSALACALSLAAALALAAAVVTSPPDRVLAAALPYPAAWSGPGPCDASPDMVRAGAAPLSPAASFHGVYACGPRPGPDWTEPGVPAQIDLYGEWQGFQCSELSSRFFYLAYGLYAAGDGSWIADDAHARHPGDVQLVENNKGALPQVGDIVSLSAGTFGHTYVITGASNVDTTSGSEDVTILEQNYSRTGVRTLKVRGWDLQDPGFRVLRWAHALKDPWSGAGGAPAPGPALTYSSAGATSVDLDWSVWPAPTGAQEFDVYRDGRYVASTGRGVTRYTDTGLAPSSSHAYYVVAQGGTVTQAVSSPVVQVTTSSGAGSPRPGDGAFVRTPDGVVYRIAGGSPLRVDDWAPFGGRQPAAPIGWGAFHELPGAPADGTFLSIARTGITYVMAGGAPLFVSDWTPYGGPQPSIDVDAGDIAALRAAPADGTFLSVVGAADAYVVAGGAPLAVAGWGPYGGEQRTVAVNADTLAGMRQIPADGTMIREAGGTTAYVVAGGAPLRVTDWASYGGVRATVPVSASTIAHLGATPWDGTFLEVAGTAATFVVAGGAPLAVTDWGPYGGPQPAVLVSGGTVAGMRATPADGTFLQAVGTATAYVVEGGVATPINDWGPYGGPQSAVGVSPASIAALPEAASQRRPVVGRRDE